jgi:hypothetical protein
MLGPALIAQIFISGFPLQFKHLHECYGSVKATSTFSANGGAPVDVRSRMNTGFANG